MLNESIQNKIYKSVLRYRVVTKFLNNDVGMFEVRIPGDFPDKNIGAKADEAFLNFVENCDIAILTAKGESPVTKENCGYIFIDRLDFDRHLNQVSAFGSARAQAKRLLISQYKSKS